MSLCIELTSVDKKYSSPVLTGLEMKLESGRFYALLGQNGAGKSTLMRILMRTEPPDSGAGRIFGVDIEGDSSELNHDIGYVSESIMYSISSPIIGLDELYSKFYPRWDSTLFKSYLEFLKLDGTKFYGQLSRGQQMQTALAVALAIRPKLLLLDEITSVLDAGARTYFMGELGKFVQQGGTIVMATNIVSEVHAYADHLLLLETGKIQMNAPVAELANRFYIIKRPKGADHSIFDSPECVLLGLEADQSLSYIVPKSLSHQNLPEQWMNSRPVNLSDAFIFFTKRKAA